MGASDITAVIGTARVGCHLVDVGPRSILIRFKDCIVEGELAENGKGGAITLVFLNSNGSGAVEFVAGVMCDLRWQVAELSPEQRMEKLGEEVGECLGILPGVMVTGLRATDARTAAGCGRPHRRDISNLELKDHLDRRIDGIGREFSDLRRENDDLKQNLSTVLSHLAQKVSPEFFQWIFVILGMGSVSAAARKLKIPGSTFADRVKEYVDRGGVYATLYSLVGVRKKGSGRKRIEHFNELFDEHQGAQAVAQPDVLRELLDGLESLNAANWNAMREELIAIVKSELPEE